MVIEVFFGPPGGLTYFLKGNGAIWKYHCWKWPKKEVRKI